MTLETRIKEYYCDYTESIIFRGQYKVKLFWKISYWNNMIYRHESLESAQKEVDEYIAAYQVRQNSFGKPTKYHKYP